MPDFVAVLPLADDEGFFRFGGGDDGGSPANTAPPTAADFRNERRFGREACNDMAAVPRRGERKNGAGGANGPLAAHARHRRRLAQHVPC